MKFRVGDRVRVLNSTSHPEWEGKETTIYDIGRVYYTTDENLDVWINNPFTGKRYDCWFHPQQLELVPSKEFEGEIEFIVEV